MAGGAGSSLGKGGMITKILAAKRAAGSGASTVIAWGREPDALLRLAQGEAIGTLLVAPTQKTQARKQWMADHLQLRGAVLVDAGAAANYASAEARLLCRKPSAEFEKLLGYAAEPEMLHRDNLVLTRGS